jgi:hypothetical protein
MAFPYVPAPKGQPARPQVETPAPTGGVGTEMLKILAWTKWLVRGE